MWPLQKKWIEKRVPRVCFLYPLIFWISIKCSFSSLFLTKLGINSTKCIKNNRQDALNAIYRHREIHSHAYIHTHKSYEITYNQNFRKLSIHKSIYYLYGFFFSPFWRVEKKATVSCFKHCVRRKYTLIELYKFWMDCCRENGFFSSLCVIHTEYTHSTHVLFI